LLVIWRLLVDAGRFIARVGRAILAFWADRGYAKVATTTSLLTIVIAGIQLGSTNLDQLATPMLGLHAFALLLLVVSGLRRRQPINGLVVVLIGACLLEICVIGSLPEYFGVLGMHAVFHRSAAEGVLMAPLGLVSTSVLLYFLLGATPRAEEVAWYPIVAAPAVLTLALYLWLLYGLALQAFPQLQLSLLTSPYLNQAIPYKTIGPTGQVSDAIRIVNQAGFLGQLIGTGLLMTGTTLIALPIGVGTGVYVAEYGKGRALQLVRLATTSLRGISVFTLGLAAVSLVAVAKATPLTLIFTGFHVDAAGVVRPDTGSFVPASIVVSMLVIPVIARATEEGCRSLPEGLREGSAALGASEGYALVRIILPWALPNIATSVLLGCAEAAGTLAPLLFIAGTGENGVGPLSQATSLAWGIFAATYSISNPYRSQMAPHQFAEVLLLLALALILSIAALTLNHRFATRYRGR
jgi:phosphate transport system permease protein